MRIRHYGFLANRVKKENVRKCRELLGSSGEIRDVVEKTIQEIILNLTGVDITRCPCCGEGTMKIVKEIPEYTGCSGYEYLSNEKTLTDTG